MSSTEEVDETRLIKAIASRRGKLSVLTRKKNEINALLEAKENKETVSKHADAFNKYLDEFMELQVVVQNLLSNEEEKEADHMDWYVPKLTHYREFVHGIKKWMDGDKEDKLEDSEEEPEDGASQTIKGSNRTPSTTSKTSSSTASSSVSTACLKAKAERAALMAKSQALETKHALDLEEAQLMAQLKAKREKHAMEAELAAAEAKINIYTESELQAAPAPLPSTSKQIKSDNITPIHTLDLTGASSEGTEYRIPVTTQKSQNPQGFLGPSVSNQAAPRKAQAKSKHLSYDQEGDSTSSINDDKNENCLTDVLKRQNEITGLLVKQQQAALLPPREIPTFDGDALQYRTFIKAFEQGIERKVDHVQDKLFYLEQYTKGAPNQLVRSFLHMDPDRGFRKAKEQLEWHFGNAMKLTSAHMDKVLSWPSIKVEDGPALRSYALFLRSCFNIMKEINFMEELETPSHLRTIVSKLPFKLRDRWRTISCDIQERNKRRAKFKDLVEFVERQSRVVLDPYFGDIQDMTDGKGVIKSTKRPTLKPPFKPASRGSSFATAVAPMSANMEQMESKIKPKYNQGEIKQGYSNALEKPCPYCSKDHTLEFCGALKHKPNKEKVDFMKSKGLCFGCLGKGHMGKYCKNRMTCHTCHKDHPSILHIDMKERAEVVNNKREFGESAGETAKVTSSLVSLHAGHTGAGNKECKLSIVPVQVKLCKGTKVVKTYAFLDPGSTATFCTEDLMAALNTSGKRVKVLLKTMGEERPVPSYKISGLEVAALKGTTFLTLPDVFSQESIPVTQDNIPTEEDLKEWPYLKEVELEPINASIGLLIGANAPKVLEPWKVINSEGIGPFAVKTLLGWVINGPLGHREDSDMNDCHPALVNRIAIANLEELLTQQYNQDFSEQHYEQKEMSLEDKQFMSTISDSAVLKDGHYYLKLPFREPNVTMPNNRHIALQRAQQLLKRFTRDQTFFGEYQAFMQEVLAKGYAEVVPQEQLETESGKAWYIPHHGVYHPRKKTLRVVFDCGSTFHGTSLNGELLQGPDLTNKLIGVMLRFRLGPVAMMTDIKSMFHQVRVAREDVDFLRFLWWPDGDITKEPVDHRMTVHIFGAVSSPSCATFALLKTAEDNQDEYPPEVVDTVRHNFYVDDCLKSVSSVEKAAWLYGNLKEMCSKGGFHLNKWISNHRSLLAIIPEEERTKEVKTLNLDRDKLPVERALGTQWDVESDTFTFSTVVKTQPITRRGILSVVSSIYDPLGFLAPVVLSAKQILQELCKAKLGWDEKIPEEHADRWKRWLDQLVLLDEFSVSRCITPHDFGEIASAQLLHFCDASEVGMGTVSYLRLTNCRDEVHVVFIMGKAKVAPLKQTTIPRLELAAAVLAVRIDRLLKTELQIPLDESAYWTDSQSVLKYIGSATARFKTFVANRVAMIQSLSEIAQWKYISSKLNPADVASRGLRADAFLQSKAWIHAPEFLRKPSSEWPGYDETPGVISVDDPEVRNTISVCAVVLQPEESPTATLLSHFSNWMDLKRAVGWILKYKDVLKQLSQERVNALAMQQSASQKSDAVAKHMQQFKDSLRLQKLTTVDMDNAEKNIICWVQRQSFKEELRSLEKGTVKRTSPLVKLDPVIVDGVLRVGGRLSRATLPEETKHPAILPKASHISTLILRHIHEKVGHSGRSHVLSTLRRKHWILHANAAARAVIRKCIICKLRRQKAGEQKMADLPIDRVLPDLPPFTHVGMDYFGPIDVKRGRSTVKRYGVIFTCLACRAVHLEVAHALDTDACINALRRFICRRGQVTEIKSDNGTNFVSSNRELKEALQELNQERIEKTLLQEGIKWTFNPPHGAHHGGVWERLIQQVKRILFSVLRQQTLDDDILQTAMCEAEAILNDRPITPSSDDPNDIEALTPNHIIQLKGKPILPPGLFRKEDLYIRRRWRQAQYITDLFWKRWMREYLLMMQQRQKWHKPRRNFTVGDLVLVVDDVSPRNSWLKGRITETMTDSKGQVRRVRLKTKTSVLERPVTKLCLLLEAE